MFWIYGFVIFILTAYGAVYNNNVALTDLQISLQTDIGLWLS